MVDSKRQAGAIEEIQISPEMLARATLALEVWYEQGFRFDDGARLILQAAISPTRDLMESLEQADKGAAPFSQFGERDIIGDVR